MQATNTTHAHVLSPVCLEKRDRVPTRHLTIDKYDRQHYAHAEANAKEEEMEELLAPEQQVSFGLSGFGSQLPTHRRATKRILVHFINNAHNGALST